MKRILMSCDVFDRWNYRQTSNYFYPLMVIFSTGYETRFTIFETVKNKHFFNANKKYLTSSIQPFNDTKLKLKSIRLVLKYHNNSNKARGSIIA